MTQAAAIRYCANQGARLPSIRELAQLAMSHGAKGIVDTCYGSGHRCYSVNATNADGSSDKFKFIYAGYRRPEGEDKWFWSSSISKIGSAFGLDGGSGVVDSDVRSIFPAAVRCVSGG